MKVLEAANIATTTEANEIVEKAVGEVYRGFFKMRQAGLYQEEYDSMGALLNMLQADRMHLRLKYKVEG